jgi:hypothetical protein
MSLQESVNVGNARLDSVQTTIGTSPLLRIYSGAEPANCAAAATGTKLVEMTLPSSWMAAASGATKAKSGSWTAAAVAQGTAGYYRIYDSTGTTCHLQGNITVTGSGGDMTLDNTSINVSQVVSVSTFQLGDGNQ